MVLGSGKLRMQPSGSVQTTDAAISQAGWARVA